MTNSREKQLIYQRKYDKANSVFLTTRVTKEVGAKFKAYCKENGTNVNALLSSMVKHIVGGGEQ